MTEIKIRPARKEDKDFIVSLVPRLTEFELPAWRDAKQMNSVDEEILSRVLLTNSSDTMIFVAEDENAIPLGFIHLKISSDYYASEKHGHISDIVVTSEGEGRGVGKALMNAAEEWAKGNKFKWLTLSVFPHNDKARKLYEKIGYGEDMIKYLKELK